MLLSLRADHHTKHTQPISLYRFFGKLTTCYRNKKILQINHRQQQVYITNKNFSEWISFFRVCRRWSASERCFRARINKHHKRSQRAPCPQWHSCSIAHIQISSPILSADHFERILEKEKQKNAFVFPRRAGASELTMRVTNCSYFEGSTFYVSTHSRL